MASPRYNTVLLYMNTLKHSIIRSSLTEAMRRRHRIIFALLVLCAIQELPGEDKPGGDRPKYDDVYIAEGFDQRTVYVYVTGRSELRFTIEPDSKGELTGVDREFTIDGVPHRIVISTSAGKVKSAVWDDRPLEPTALTRQEINDIRRANERAAKSRTRVADATATDEERLNALHAINEALAEYPFLAVGDEPASLVRYQLRALGGVQLELINTPVEVAVTIIDGRGVLHPLVRKEFDGGHTLEIHCSNMQVSKVIWDGKLVPPGFVNRRYYVMPPGSISVSGVAADEGPFHFQRRENGQMQTVRLFGKVLQAREKESDPYYLAEDFSAAEILADRGKLITVFHANLLAEKPKRKPELKSPAKSAGTAAPKKESALAMGTDAGVRTWSDASGKFSVRARLIEIRDSRIVLERDDGKRVEVSVSQLSTADQNYLGKLAKPQSGR